MADSTFGGVHQNQALDNGLIGYKNQQYVLAGNVIKKIPVKFKSDDYYIYDKGCFFRREARVGTARGKVPRVGFTYSTATYNCEPYELAVEIPQRLRDNMDPAIKADLDGGRKALDQVLLDQEIRAATLLATTANWSTTVAIGAGSEFDSAGGGDPLGVIETAIRAVRSGIGVPANTIVMTWTVARVLRTHAAIQEYIKYSNTPNDPSVADATVLAKVFGVDNVYIVGGMYDSADEGGTSTLTNILTDTTWIGYVAPNPGFMEPSAAYIFEWKPPSIESWSENDPKQLVVKAESSYDAKATLAAAGYTLTNCSANI